jgi:vancomycin resistance protein YoaR
MKKYLGKYLTGICLLALALGMTVNAEEATILKGVKIDQVDVSGMTKTEAMAALADYETQLGEESLKLEIGDNELEVNLSEFGVTFDNTDAVEDALSIGRTGNIVKRYKDQKDLQSEGKTYSLSWKADEDLVRSYVESECTQFDQKAQNASLSRSNGSFDFVAGTQGLELDVDAAVSTIMDYLENDWSSEKTDEALTLQTVVTEPEGSAEELAYVTDLLGSYTTSYSTSGANRCKNVNSAAEHINGTVLYPGESFSTLSAITPFTEENGYAMAGSYLNGEVVESMGGGICQVSTTLYNAVLRAELEVSERYPHSMIVHYVDLSSDAAIAESGGKDFKFVNSTDYPIYIEGYTTSDKKITFNIYGKETRDSNRSISFESVKLSETPASTVLIENASAPIGSKSVKSGDSGYTAELYKIVTVNGVQTERTLVNKSTYKGGKRTVTYGTAGDPTLSENLRAAIALQDEALADANVAAAAAAATPTE